MRKKKKNTSDIFCFQFLPKVFKVYLYLISQRQPMYPMSSMGPIVLCLPFICEDKSQVPLPSGPPLQSWGTGAGGLREDGEVKALIPLSHQDSLL